MNTIRLVTGLLIVTTLACGLLDTAVDKAVSGDTNFTSASELWSDVPQMEGLTASQTDMPVYIKTVVRLVIGNLGLLNSEGEDRTTGKVDWIVFDTDQPPDDVKAFYTPERMAENGWEQTDQSTCVQGSDFGVTEVGALCVFAKEQDGVQTQLAIITSQDEETKNYHVFFLRLEETPTPAPDQTAQPR